MLTSRPAIAVYTVALVAAFLGGVAYASIPGPTGVINGCYANTAPHTLRVIDSSARCPSGTTSLNWNAAGPPGPGGVDGIKEFMGSGSWTAPAGITHVLVEAWGAGGGGGGMGGTVGMCPFGDGGGGGGGGYLRTVVAVTPGQAYSVAVGTGGAAGANGGSTGTNGGGGGNSSLSAGGSSLAIADGGGGGMGATMTVNGQGGAGGSTSSGVSIARKGQAGATGSPCPNGPGGPGGTSFTGTMEWNASGGAGGGPAETPSRGTNGYLLLIW